MSAERTRIGMGLFVLSEAVFFLLLVLAYVTYHRTQGNGPDAANSLDLTKASVFSVFLLASSATMALAVRGFRRGSTVQTIGGLLATLVLGGVFLVGQAMEYSGLLHRGVTISRNLFGTTFFTLTGFHGLHVLIGLVMIGTLAGIASFGRRTRVRPGQVEAISIYWHFVDGVWVVIFGVVYLWAFL